MDGPMLPVVSTSRTTSGLGGLAGVWTTLSTVNDTPGLALRSTVAGSTPGAANAGVATAQASAVAPPSMTAHRPRRARTPDCMNGTCKVVLQYGRGRDTNA